MGVKGLTSFIAQIDRSLAHQADFPSKDPSSSTQDSPSDPSSSSSSSTNPFLVIDGWAWLYNAYLDNFPKTSKGGQYLQFTQLIKQLVFAWRSAGLDFAFVFDGPAEPKKVPVITSRSDAQCQKNASTMRLSSFSRASSKQGLLPPLTYLTAITTLKELGVEIIFAETEADGIVAELSESRRGYAVSQDSDFFILCSKEKGCLGYVPLNTLEFVWKLPSHSIPQQITETNQETMNVPEDDGFAPVKSKGKSSRRNGNQNNNNNFHNSSYSASSTALTNGSDRQEGNLTVSQNPPPIPTSSSSSTSYDQSKPSAQPILSSFRFKSYLSSDLASHLELPPNLLPLLAALCGNDFTSNKHSQLLYSNLGKSASKIPFVAKTLREEWLKSQNPKAKKGNVSKSSSSSRLNSGANTPSLSYKASFGSKELPSGGLSSGPKSDSGRSAVSNATVTTSSPASSPSKKDQVGKLSNKLSSIALANLTELNNSNSASKDNPHPSYSKANSIISESDAQTVSNLTGSGFLGSDLDQSEELDPVKSLVKSVIERLLELNYGNLKAGRDSYISSGDKEELIEGVLQGFESYSFVSSQISFLTNPSFEFFNPEDRLGNETNHSGNNHKRGSEVLKSYNESYQKGRLDTFLIEALTSRHWITKPFLEDPDEISTQAGAGKKLREWIYAVLFDVWGTDWCRDEMEIIEEDEEEDENENDQDEIQFADELGEYDNSLRRKKWIGGDGYNSGEDPDDVISVNDDTSGSEFSNSCQSDKAPIHSIRSKNAEDQSSSQIETEDLNPDQILPIRPSSVISNFYKDEDADDEKPIRKKSKRGNKDLPPPAVTEYIRRGTRLTPELVRIKSLTELLKGGSSEDSSLSENPIHKILKSNFNPLPSSLGDLLAHYEAAQAVNPVEDVNASISTIKSDPFPSPIPSHPLSTRFDLFLVANHSNLKSFREKVPKNLWLFISSIRFMIIEAASRHLETSKKKNWKRKEIEVLLKVGICCLNLNQRIIKDETFSIQQCLDQLVSEEKRRNLFNLNTVRQIHLNSTIQMILEINFYLCQSLLIDEELGSDPEKFIDGELLVLELCRMENKSNPEGINEPLLPKEGFEEKDEENVKVYLEVVLQGLEDVLGIDVEEERRLRKLEKKMAGKGQDQQSGTNSGNGKGGNGGKKVNPFDLLGEE